MLASLLFYRQFLLFLLGSFLVDQNLDHRNYQVNFDKIEKKLNFKCSKSIEFGIKEIKNFLKRKNNFNINIKRSKYNNYISEKLSFFDK